MGKSSKLGTSGAAGGNWGILCTATLEFNQSMLRLSTWLFLSLVHTKRSWLALLYGTLDTLSESKFTAEQFCDDPTNDFGSESDAH